ncbi:MAG: helicase-related protein [Spirochaetota bacterium]
MIDVKNLPVYQHRDVIVAVLKKNQVIVVESPTGSGKTTQIPKILYDAGLAGDGRIGVTQPRRIAALSVSHFIARQYGTTIPGLVGYKMRFVDETIEGTRIIIMTDGILLQELKADPYLSNYSIIMVDEAHERSLNIDFILGLLKGILREREDLKVVISSATINAQVFSEYFDECPIVSIDATMYPVELRYEPPEYLHDFTSIVDKIVEIVKRVEREGKPGDILIFLSGEEQIKLSISALSDLNRKKSMVILPLYARLSQEEQERVFLDFPGKRKVIVATNIAETSITIDGIRYVIDPGFAKLNYYNPANFTSSLVEVPISKASCNQRKGRAGRTAPGVCYRLYTREDYDERPLFTIEEIYRRDLSEVVLRMAELGIRDFERFDFISNPGPQNIRGAVETLLLLGAIDEERNLTSTGRLMVQFPIVPRLSRMIVAAIMEYPDVLEEVLIAAAFLNDKPPFLLPQGLELEARRAHHSFRHKLGDFLSYVKIFRAFEEAKNREDFCERFYFDYRGMQEIYNVNKQLGEIVSKMGIPITGGGDPSHYLCAVSEGLLQFVCKKTQKNSYSSLTAYGIKIHPGSIMYRQRPDYIVAGEILRTSQLYAMSVSPLRPEWIKSISPELYNAFVGLKERVRRKKVVATRDYTNFVRIGRDKFEIQVTRKKKVAILPYEKLIEAIAGMETSLVQDYRDLRGMVLLDGGYLMSEMKLNRILKIVPKMAHRDTVVDQWPKGRRFNYLHESNKIVQFIPFLLHPCRKAKTKNRLGFLTLLTDGGGYYWFSSYNDFTQALEESVSSLESLIDEDENVMEEEQEKIVNETYRHLTELLEE